MRSRNKRFSMQMTYNQALIATTQPELVKRLPMELYLADAVREIDRYTIEDRGVPGITLMKRAAQACVTALLERSSELRKVAVFCGSGNNAGDGFIIAALLADKGYQVNVCLVGNKPVQGTDAGLAYDFCEQSQATFTSQEAAIDGAEVVVDALLGTGIAGDIRPAFAAAIELINASEAKVLAVDLPSGLSADTGKKSTPCVRAGLTVTFIANKLGLMTCDGPEVVGELLLDDLAVETAGVPAVSVAASCLSYDQLITALPRRDRNAHKVSHGHLLVIGGNHGMAGAVAMAGEAALSAGAGMVTVATYPGNEQVVVSRRPEVMARGVASEAELLPLLARCTAIVIGPGLGQDEWSRILFNAALSAGLPLVIDADGLNLLAAVKPDSTSVNWILTPHPGEAARLLNVESSVVQADRYSAIKRVHSAYGGVVLLKGAGTLIRGEQTTLCPYGNPGMSVAGMGDVLSGVIGGLLVQGLKPEAATQLGAVVHSYAADKRVERQGERGLLATELLPEIRALINQRSC